MNRRPLSENLRERRSQWGTCEELLANITDRRQTVYFDFSVEHGIAVAVANGLTHATKTQRAIAERIVQDVIRTGVPRDDAVRAALLAVWGLSRRHGRAPVPRASARSLPSRARVSSRRRADRDGGERP